jgi:Xaa-Pro aminopeptidase
MKMVSEQERERRLTAMRKAMDDAGFEALVVCTAGTDGRGRIRYLDGVYLWGGRSFYILPAKGEPAMIQPAYVGSEWGEAVGWCNDHRSAVDPARAVAEALRDMGLHRSAIGIVGLEELISVRDLRTLQDTLSEASFQAATMLFDRVRLVKSDEEIGCIRDTSAIFRRAYQALESALKPGMTERDAMAEAVRNLMRRGCHSGFAHISRSGGLPMLHPPTDDVIEQTDVITCDLEFVGPEGYALELSRHFSFGLPPDPVRRLYDMQVEAFQDCLAAMQPGNSSSEILKAADDSYRKHGHFAAGPVGRSWVQFHAHGIGLDFEEPPLVPGLEVTLRPGMVVSLHPHPGPEDPTLPAIKIEDNVLITDAGPERLTYAQDGWVVL